MISINDEQDFAHVEAAVRRFYQTSDVMPCEALLSVEYMAFKKKVLQRVYNNEKHMLRGVKDEEVIKAFLPTLKITYCRNQCWLNASEPLNVFFQIRKDGKECCQLPLKRTRVHQ